MPEPVSKAQYLDRLMRKSWLVQLTADEIREYFRIVKSLTVSGTVICANVKNHDITMKEAFALDGMQLCKRCQQVVYLPNIEKAVSLSEMIERNSIEGLSRVEFEFLLVYISVVEERNEKCSICDNNAVGDAITCRLHSLYVLNHTESKQVL